jgi:hypothetical protein
VLARQAEHILDAAPPLEQQVAVGVQRKASADQGPDRIRPARVERAEVADRVLERDAAGLTVPETTWFFRTRLRITRSVSTSIGALRQA